MKVLVAHSYFLRLDPKQWAKMRPYPPLATLYVAGILRRDGHEVSVFDAMLADDESAFATALAHHRPEVVVLYEDNFNFLSKMCLSRMREAALSMIVMAKLAGAAVAVSGSDVTDHPDPYLAVGADLAVVGEGDHAVREFVQSVAADRLEADRRTIAGSAHRPESSSPVVLRTEARRPERHPDVFGFPARDLVDIAAYARAWRSAHGRFSLNIVSTRGCPFHCNWCAKPIWGQRYAMRSALDVATEMTELAATHAPDHLWFADDIFGLRVSWLSEFVDHLEASGTRIPFTIQSRCDLMSPETVALLARAGCEEVWLGAESGSQAVLDAMDKQITVDDIRSARRALGAAGIRAGFFVQFGYPGERWSDIQATVALVRETLPDDVGISVSYPLPGTRFHAMVADQLGDKTNWEVSGDLEMMFAGTYTSDFYRHLHRALHDDLDLRRREAGLTRAPAPFFEPVDLDGHRRRVSEQWAELERLEATAAHPAPTVLAPTGPRPLPDLSRSFG